MNAITSRTASQIQGRILSYLVFSHKTSGLSFHGLIDCGVSESPASLSRGCLQPYDLSTVSKTLFGLNRGQPDFCSPVGEMPLGDHCHMAMEDAPHKPSDDIMQGSAKAAEDLCGKENFET